MNRFPATWLSLVLAMLCAGHGSAKDPFTIIEVEPEQIRFKPGQPASGLSLESALENTRSIKILQEAVRVLAAYPDLQVEVHGFADSHECSPATCRPLSLARAEAVRDWLLANGLAPGRIESTKGFGDSRPLMLGTAPDAQARNRRAEINPILDLPTDQH
jgi:hypothetical protein